MRSRTSASAAAFAGGRSGCRATLACAAIALWSGAASGGEAPEADTGKNNVRLLARLAALEREFERRERQIDRMHKIILAQQKALEVAKANMRRAERHRAEMENQYDNARQQLAVAQKENARLKKDLHHHAWIIERLEDADVPVRELVFAGEAVPPKPIHGEVISVKADAKQVTLSVGSDDGVKERYRFTIYRGERYIGKVEVADVFADTSAAKVLPDWRKEKIREGDDAATGFEQQPRGDKPPNGSAHEEAAPGRDEVVPAVDQPPVHLSRTPAGSVWACGANTWGQLGTGDTMERKVPCLVRGLGGVVQVAAGRNVSLALRGDGTVWTWGAYCTPDDDGELVTSHEPVMVAGLLDVAAVAVYDLRCFALLGSGEVHEWRAGGDSIVHTRAGRTERPMGMHLAGNVAGVQAGAAGPNVGILRRWVEPRLSRWRDRGGDRPVPPEGRPRKADAPGWGFCLVLDGEGAVWGRGRNKCGQLGTGGKSPREEGTARMLVPGVIVSVAAGSFHSLIVTGDETPNTAPLAEGTRIPGVAGEPVPLRPRAIDREGGRLELNIVRKPSHGRVERRGGGLVYIGDAEFAGEDRFTYHVSDGELPSETAKISVDVLPNVPRGALVGWGKNRHGQVGNGTFENQHLPVPVSGLRGVVQADAGHDHAVALLKDGSVWCWGQNDHGQLGDGTYEERSFPTRVRELGRARAIAAGFDFTVALMEDGTVRTWGWNSRGKLGNGSTVDSNTPVAVKGLAGVVTVTAGEHALALADDGTVWAWGSNYRGHLGIGASRRSQLVPVRIPGLGDIVAVSAAGCHSLALDRNGRVWAWGLGAMVGDGRDKDSPRPVRLETLSDVTAIAAGESANLALRKDGSVWTWGRSARLQAGPLPGPVEGIGNVVQIAAGYWHGLVMTADGNLWSWGLNASGQLGDGNREPSSKPVPVGPVPNVKVIAAGGWNSFVIWDGPAPSDAIDARGNDTF